MDRDEHIVTNYIARMACCQLAWISTPG